MTSNVNRRDFLKGAGLTALAAGALGLAGCGQPQTASSQSLSSTGTANAADTSSYNVTEEIDTDIVIVGAGIAGIAAAVQAGENGDRVVLMDWAAEIGGAGIGVEGTLGWNSPLQKEQGIEFDANELVIDELAGANYLVDATAWRRLMAASGDNIEWLMGHGVEFSGVVDTYPIAYPDGTIAQSKYDVFHWFGGGSAYDNYEGMAGGSAYEGYVKPLTKVINDYGVDVRLNTRGTDLVFDDEGRVAGVYALTDESAGTYLKVNAPVVIIATGGILNDAERMSARGFDPDLIVGQIVPGSSGDGARMAIDQAGAREYFRTAYEGWNGVPGSPTNWSTIGVNLGFGGPVLWVNEFGERFTDENVGMVNFDSAFVPRQCFRQQWAFASKSFVESTLLNGDEELIADWKNRMAQEPENALEGDDVAALAEQAGIDPETFAATVDRYNELCQAKEDVDFRKDPAKLVAFTEPPYQLWRLTYAFDSSFGDVCTDRFFRAVTKSNEPIDGLYVIGVESCLLYSNVYRINVPGSGSANSINSGRVAANHAHETLTA